MAVLVEHHVEGHSQADRQADFVHLELRRMVRAGHTVIRRDADPEIASRAFFQEQAHVITAHHHVGFADAIRPYLIDGAAMHEGRLRIMVDHRRAAFVGEGQVRLRLVGMRDVGYKGAQALHDLFADLRVEGAQGAPQRGGDRNDVVFGAGDDLPDGQHRRFLGRDLARHQILHAQ